VLHRRLGLLYCCEYGTNIMRIYDIKRDFRYEEVEVGTNYQLKKIKNYIILGGNRHISVFDIKT